MCGQRTFIKLRANPLSADVNHKQTQLLSLQAQLEFCNIYTKYAAGSRDIMKAPCPQAMDPNKFSITLYNDKYTN
jgi:hypothetical protein